MKNKTVGDYIKLAKKSENFNSQLYADAQDILRHYFVFSGKNVLGGYSIQEAMIAMTLMQLDKFKQQDNGK